MIYGKLGSSQQYVNPKDTDGLILMEGERPTADSIATADGTWADKPATADELYFDTMAFLDNQTNPYEMGAFGGAVDNTLAQENIEWFNGVWSSYYEKKALLPTQYVIDYNEKPHSYSEVFAPTESE